MDAHARGRVRRAGWRVWEKDVATRPAGAWRDLGGLVAHATGLPFRPWNGAHLVDEAGLARVGAAREWFGHRGLPWGLLVPADLPAEPTGMDPVTDMRVMARPLAGLASPDRAELRWGDLESAAAVQAEAFEGPPERMTAFLHPKLVNPACAVVTAYLDGVPASTATIVVSDGVAGVYGVGTVTAARRRGLGAAVTLAALHEAVRRGCDLAFLNPTDSGEPLYRALGFEDAVGWRIWADPEVSAPAS